MPLLLVCVVCVCVWEGGAGQSTLWYGRGGHTTVSQHLYLIYKYIDVYQDPLPLCLYLLPSPKGFIALWTFLGVD